MKMKVEERLSRARIQIQRKNSFFAYLSLYLKFKESKDLPDYAGAGVNAKGDFFYKKEFFEKLTDDNIEGIIAHEILHLSLLHLLRVGSRDAKLWNISADIVVNQLLKDNGFKLPDGCITSDYDNVVEIGGVKIEDCDKKTAEYIYSELEKQAKKIKKQLGDDGSGGGMRFDEHIKGDGKGKELSEVELKECEKEWSDRTQEALTISRMRGDTPSGIGRLVGELHKEKINWKALLNQYITQQIPYNSSYSFPHKKSISVGYYMPHQTKEQIDISIMVDLSGSVGGEELTDFLSEICGIARAYQERINMRIFSHDTECYDNGEVRNGNIDEIMKMELKGGGGTSFSNPIKYLEDNNVNPKCVIWLSDGYGDKFEKPNFPILWVLSKGGSDDLLKDSGQVIKLED